MSTKSILNHEIEVVERGGPASQDEGKPELQSGRSDGHPLCLPYSVAVIAAGATVLVYSAYRAISGYMEFAWAVFALLTFVTAAFSLKLPKSEIRVSVPDVFVFCSILLFGAAAGALTAAMEGLMGSLRTRTKSRQLHFAAFNISAMSLSAYTAGKMYELLRPEASDVLPYVGMLQQVIFSMVVLAVYYYVLNTGLLAIKVCLERRRNAIQIWVECFSWMGLGYLAAGLMAGMMSITAQVISLSSVVLLSIVPIATYTTYRHVLRIMSENIKLKEKAAA